MQVHEMKPNSYQLDTYSVLRHILVSKIWRQELRPVLAGGKATRDDVVERVQPKLVESRTHAGVVDETNSPGLSSFWLDEPRVLGWLEGCRIEGMGLVLREPSLSVSSCRGRRRVLDRRGALQVPWRGRRRRGVRVSHVGPGR